VDFVTSDQEAKIMAMTEQLNFDDLDRLLQDVKGIAQKAVNNGTALHIVEKDLLEKLLQLGHSAVGAMFQSLGNGDVGETLSIPEHAKPLNRYPELSNRTYRSIFGDFELSRYLYGEAPKTKALSFRWQATHLGLKEKPLRDMQRICTFLERNADKMKYNQYLALGYPIATGFIEGACRHVIKDRMERSGMRWSVQGAQYMLYLRCVDAAGLWRDFNEVHQHKALAIYGNRTNFKNSFQLAA